MLTALIAIPALGALLLDVLPKGKDAMAKYSAMTATSMIRPPASEYSRNFTAAYWRCAPPNDPIRK